VSNTAIPLAIIHFAKLEPYVRAINGYAANKVIDRTTDEVTIAFDANRYKERATASDSGSTIAMS